MPPTHLLQSPVDLLRRQEMTEPTATTTVHLINILLLLELLELQCHHSKYFF